MSTQATEIAVDHAKDPLVVGVETVIAAAGSQTALAEKLSALTGKPVKQSRVSMWVWRGRIPHDWVIPCEKAVSVSRHQIRPDLHPTDVVA